MLDISDVAEGILNGASFTIHYRLSSWLAEECLAEDIPAVDVVEELDWSMRVPERLTFRVPVTDDQGVSWVPTSYRSPLGWFGQRIYAEIGVGTSFGEVEWINRGVFLLHSAETSGDAISVEAVGLLQLADEAELATEFQPTSGATFSKTLRQLIEPGIPVDIDAAPTDKTIPKSAVTWSDNRLDDVYTILENWPAQARVGAEGTLVVAAIPGDPDDDDVVFTFSDDEVFDDDGLLVTPGTVVEWSTSGSREDGFNAVIMEGAYDDDRGALSGLPIVHTVLDLDVNSPYNLIGEFSPYLVGRKFQNPLLNEHTEVLLAAYAKMRDLHRRAARTVQIQAVPHPALTLDDAVSVTSTRLGIFGELGRVTAVRLPYTADGSNMEVTVRLKGFL